jgi:hypothetical protein
MQRKSSLWFGRAPRSHRALRLATLAALAFASGSATAQISFADTSNFAGVNYAGESYGASFGDFNNDGLLDIFASNHRVQPSLFLNLGNGRFHETGPQVLTWRNRARADTHGGSFADFDSDGDQDLVVSTGTGNLSHFLVNDGTGRLVDQATTRGLTVTNVGGRLPVWLDYNSDGRTDFVMTQYGGIAKIFRQNANGSFTETTNDLKVVCKRFHYGHLYDVNQDGRVDFLCPDEGRFPQKIYDTGTFPWTRLFDSTSPNGLFPIVEKVVDSVIADFNNDGQPDMFLLSGAQLRPTSIERSGKASFEAQLTGGTKGFRFRSTGRVTFWADWNKSNEQSGTDIRKIQIGRNARNPSSLPFTLDPSDPSVVGMPPPPTQQTQLPLMQIGFDPSIKQWTLVLQTKLSPTSPNVFSEAYLMVNSTADITNLAGTGLWPSDKASTPTLLMNRNGRFVNETARAGLDAPIQCVSATAGDFDNDMDVDIYLACRTGARNIANILYENLGNGTFRMVGGAGGAAGPQGVAVATGAGTADSVISGDYDGDGFLDLFVTNGFNLRPLGFGGENKLYRNRGSSGNNWVQVDLVGTRGIAEAVGARVYALTGNGTEQLRVQNGGYHRWSQDAKRLHFGLARFGTVDLRVEWPSGHVQWHRGVAANRVYRITESGGIAQVRLGEGPAYPCGAPPLDGKVDRGVFIWRDCPTGEWRMKMAAGGAILNYSGQVTSTQNYVSVKPQGLETVDQINWTSNPRQITFSFDTRYANIDGFNFRPQEGARTCLRIDAPANTKVHYGPFRAEMPTQFDLETQGACWQ